SGLKLCKVWYNRKGISFDQMSSVAIQKFVRRPLVKRAKCGFKFKRRNSSMDLLTMRQRARRITWFVTVQLIALVGWIFVQSFFSLSALGHTIPFAVTIVIEAIWWIATLVIMFLLFKREYNGFVKAVLELEEANKSLRKATNDFLLEQRNPSEK